MTYSYYMPNALYPYQISPYLPVNQPTYNAQTQQAQQQAVLGRVIPVSAKEEATATPVDVVTGQPTFFYNKAKNELYLKQCDVPTGTPIFKTFVQISEPLGDDLSPLKTSGSVNIYEKEFKHLNEGIDSLHRLISELKEVKNDEPAQYVEYTSKSTKSDDDVKPVKRKQSAA